MPAFRSPVALSDAKTRDLVYRLRLATVIGSGTAISAWLLNGFLLFEESLALDDAALGAVAFLFSLRRGRPAGALAIRP